jgi:FtsH-binding integral membrane protein
MEVFNFVIEWLARQLWDISAAWAKLVADWVLNLIDPVALVEFALLVPVTLFELVYYFLPPEVQGYVEQVGAIFLTFEAFVAIVLFFLSPVVDPTILVMCIGIYAQIWMAAIVLRSLVWAYGMIPGGQGGK